MLRDMLPGLSSAAVLLDPASVSHARMIKGLTAAAQELKIKVLQVWAGTTLELEKAFSSLAKERVQALIVQQTPFFNSQIRTIRALVLARAGGRLGWRWCLCKGADRAQSSRFCWGAGGIFCTETAALGENSCA